MSVKEKILIAVICTTLAVTIAGAVWATVSPNTPNREQESSTASENEDSKDLREPTSDSQTINNDKVDTTKQDSSTFPQKSVTKQTQPDSNSTSQPVSLDSNKKSSKSQQTSSTQSPTQPQVASCDEDMKESYTNLRDSQIASENAAWVSKITTWNNYASGNGMSYSGYTQSMINENKPAHDARIAQIHTTYQLNIASINCK